MFRVFPIATTRNKQLEIEIPSETSTMRHRQFEELSMRVNKQKLRERQAKRQRIRHARPQHEQTQEQRQRRRTDLLIDLPASRGRNLTPIVTLTESDETVLATNKLHEDAANKKMCASILCQGFDETRFLVRASEVSVRGNALQP